MNVATLIPSLGYLVVFAMVAAESLGVPLPGETTLVLAAIYAGQSHRLSIWLLFVVAAVAAILGDNIGYWIGDKGGYRVVRAIERHGIRIWLGHWRTVRPIDEAKLKVARYLFDQHGPKVVFFGRFVSVLRTYAAFLAGVNRMRWRRFAVANAAGGIVWAAIYTFAAYLAGTALERATGTISVILGVLAVTAVVIGFILTRRRLAVLTVRAEAAYPGPFE